MEPRDIKEENNSQTARCSEGEGLITETAECERARKFKFIIGELPPNGREFEAGDPELVAIEGSEENFRG
jgi:hypothetical protein